MLTTPAVRMLRAKIALMRTLLLAAAFLVTLVFHPSVQVPSSLLLLLFSLPFPLSFYRRSFIDIFIDADECLLGTANCSSNGTCFNTQGGYLCECPTGYQSNGLLCLGMKKKKRTKKEEERKRKGETDHIL